MPRPFTVMILSIALALTLARPAMADTTQTWPTTVRATMLRVLTRQPDLKALAATRDLRFVVHFEFRDDGRVAQVDIRDDNITEEAEAQLRRQIKALIFPPPPSSLRLRRFTLPVRMLRTRTPEEIKRIRESVRPGPAATRQSSTGNDAARRAR